MKLGSSRLFNTCEEEDWALKLPAGPGAGSSRLFNTCEEEDWALKLPGKGLQEEQDRERERLSQLRAQHREQLALGPPVALQLR
jgi:hypothetical protein